MKRSNTGEAARGRDEFRRYRSIINILVEFFSLFPEKLRIFALNFSRNINGKKGIAIRYILLKTLAKKCGDNVAILEGVYLKNVNNIKFGSNISIHAMAYVEGAGGIQFGDNVSVANGATLVSTEHNYSDISRPIKEKKKKMAPVIIEDDVWIGSRAVVLSGSRIQKGCIIGAGAVVTKDTEKYSVYVGIPAVKIKDRKTMPVAVNEYGKE